MKVYFKNLDGLRFIAAFLVILHHAQYFKSISPVPLSSFFAFYFSETGKMGVNLFFVLSGFLISFLLMTEHKATGSINLRKFYIRRILRIWPLYFAYGLAIILLSSLFFHDFGGTTLLNLLFLLFFSVNIQFVTIGHNPGMAEILWSVCVEEQFYLIWPLILKKYMRKIIGLIAVLFIAGLLSKCVLSVIVHFSHLGADYKLLFNYVMLPNKVELFAAGMTGAYLLFKKERYKSLFAIIQKRPVQIIIIAIALLYTFTNLYLDDITSYYLSDFAGCLTYGLVVLLFVQPNCIVNLEYPLFNTLGKISYGIYLFHPPICHLTLVTMTKFLKIPNSFINYDIIYPLLAASITAILAYLSYELFEKRFLKMKEKYTIVKTRI